MMETFKQLTFEAAHQTPPFSGLYGRWFLVCRYLRREPDPAYGSSHDLYNVETIIDAVEREVDHPYRNNVKELEVPTLENVRRVFNRFDRAQSGLDRLVVRRGVRDRLKATRPLRTRNAMNG
jgi:6-pyruvoyltetrahydropterin/6-carboxytetrahydropterin synthase